MAIQVGDNFDHKSKKPLDGRISYATLALMKAVADANIYEGCVCYCVENDKYYKFLSTNTVDQTTGKWREYSSGGGGSTYTAGDGIVIDNDEISVDEMPTADMSDVIYPLPSSSGGGGGSYTAGDGIVITNDEISTDNATAEDMEEIIPTLPSVMSRRFKYSTTEQVVGTWIDGKPLYQKTLTGTTGNINVVKSLGTITNIDKLVHVIGVVTRSSGQQDVLCDDKSAIAVASSSLNVIVTTNVLTNCNCHVIALYTKTTDTTQ